MSNDLASKEGREKCWKSRDEFWNCLELNNEDKSMCKLQRELFEKDCSKTWVKHFDRRREYLKFKNVIDSGDKDRIDEYFKSNSNNKS